MRFRAHPSWLFALALFCAAGSAPAAEGWDRKKVEALAAAWWKARPKTQFDAWDMKVRNDLLAEAKALGPIPEGSLEEVRDLLWRVLKKEWPKRDGKITTPYGEATWIQNGKGGGKQGLVLGLHGGGEGAGNASEAAGKWNLPGCIGIFPQGVKLVHDTWNTVHGERFLLTLIEIAKVQLDVDPDRVYSMGFSMGGTGSWFMAGRHPDLLAAACPCAGVLMASPKSQVWKKEDVKELQYGFVPNVRNLAMYWFIGLADDHCMPGTYLYAWDALQELRKQDPGGYANLTFSTYPGLGHAFPAGEPAKLLKWAAEERRTPYPSRVVWECAESPFPQPEGDPTDEKVGRVQNRDFYWLHCDRPADKSLATGTVKDNAIEFSVPGGYAEDFSFWLNPKMIDVTKEVVVKVDGKVAYRGKPVPDVLSVLESLDAKLDRTLTFDRRIRLAKD